MAPTKQAEEPKQALPINHPQSGYVSPDLSLQDGTGTLSDDEQGWHDDRNDAREEEVEAIATAEDKVVKDEARAAEEKAAQTETTQTKQTETKATPKATTS